MAILLSKEEFFDRVKDLPDKNQNKMFIGETRTLYTFFVTWKQQSDGRWFRMLTGKVNGESINIIDEKISEKEYFKRKLYGTI